MSDTQHEALGIGEQATQGSRFWAAVDVNPLAVIVVLGPEGRLLGTFTTYARAYDYAVRNSKPGEPAMLIPQVVDAPEWGNTVVQ